LHFHQPTAQKIVLQNETLKKGKEKKRKEKKGKEKPYSIGTT
jgi:hypothetical protein